MSGGQVSTSGQGSVTQSSSKALSGSASSTGAGTIVADAGNGIAISGAAATPGIGNSASSSFIGLRSRKVGSGTVAYLLGGTGLPTGQGSLLAGPQSATVGVLLSGAQGSLTKSRTMALAGSAVTGSSGTLGVQTGSSAITSDVRASRTTGTAPLFVHFDAAFTTSSNSSITDPANGGAFRQITHAFNFGDSSAGTWAYTGLSKNTKTGGPITGHVYETPGTYIVNVTHSHSGTSDKAATPITITVADPDIVYAGTATICINGTGANDGLGPTGCAYQASFGTPVSNRRYLFKRGGTYGGISIGGGLTGIRVGAYGSGAKPIIPSGINIGGNPADNDIALQDLNPHGYVISNAGHHLLTLRLDLTSPSLSVGFYFDETSNYLDMRYHACVDCSADDPGMATMGGGAYGVLSKSWIAGFYVPHVFQHEVRIINSYKIAIEHCRLPYINGYSGVGHSIKMHAQYSGGSPAVWDEISTAVNLATTYNCIANNVLHDPTSNGNWTVAVDSQNAQVQEGVSDVIIENNQFYRGSSGSSVDIVMGGRRITYRGNTSLNSTMLYATGTNNPPAGWDGPYFSS